MYVLVSLMAPHIFEHLGISNFFAIINNVIMMNLLQIFLPLQYDCEVKEKTYI